MVLTVGVNEPFCRDLFPGGLRPPAAWAPEELNRV